eukprot:3548805-Rhodomonas_salina.1
MSDPCMEGGNEGARGLSEYRACRTAANEGGWSQHHKYPGKTLFFSSTCSPTLSPGDLVVPAEREHRGCKSAGGVAMACRPNETRAPPPEMYSQAGCRKNSAASEEDEHCAEKQHGSGCTLVIKTTNPRGLTD